MNVSTINNCYGCGVCAIACSRNIIEIRLNSDGFYEPYINDAAKCTDCGLCVAVCSYSHGELSLEEASIESYAAWSNDDKVRRKCSSGGVGFEVGRTLISQGYKVCGVRYDVDKNRAEHYVASTVEELIPSIGSKYIQSYTVDGFKAIDRKEKYLVTGTPCQIDSFRRYVQKFHCEENFVLMDFFCHGVPSMLLWQKYVAWAEKKVGKLTYVSWRNKFAGWHDSWAMYLEGERADKHDTDDGSVKEKGNSISSRWTHGDMFYCLFLSDSCLGKACYNHCKFKYNHSSADIRIGDMWGKTYKDNEDGVSAVVSFTTKGDELLQLCNCTLVKYPFDIVAESQMKSMPIAPKYSHRILSVLRSATTPLSYAAVYPIVERKIRKCKGRLNHILQILKIK